MATRLQGLWIRYKLHFAVSLLAVVLVTLYSAQFSTSQRTNKMRPTNKVDTTQKTDSKPRYKKTTSRREKARPIYEAPKATSSKLKAKQPNESKTQKVAGKNEQAAGRTQSNSQKKIEVQSKLPTQPEAAAFLIDEDRLEADRMHKYLNSNPALQRAAICILMQKSRLKMLRSALQHLHKNFNQQFRYPILLFHERDVLPLRDQLRKELAGPVFFQMVFFQVPEFITKRFGSAETVKLCPWAGKLGYRHMCRFHAKTFYEQPALRGLEFYWRLDDDSELTSNITVDLFQQFNNSGAVYGYFQTNLDSPLCVHDLWKVTRQFIAEKRLRPTFFNWIPETFMFFNNFEMSRLRFWWSPECRSFVEMVDLQGGVYTNRWGDAPIKTIGLSLFVPPEKIAKFVDIGYKHLGNQQINVPTAFLEQLKISGKPAAVMMT